MKDDRKEGRNEEKKEESRKDSQPARQPARQTEQLFVFFPNPLTFPNPPQPDPLPRPRPHPLPYHGFDVFCSSRQCCAVHRRLSRRVYFFQRSAAIQQQLQTGRGRIRGGVVQKTLASEGGKEEEEKEFTDQVVNTTLLRGRRGGRGG